MGGGGGLSSCLFCLFHHVEQFVHVRSSLLHTQSPSTPEGNFTQQQQQFALNTFYRSAVGVTRFPPGHWSEESVTH